jgi:hypothetical protein
MVAKLGRRPASVYCSRKVAWKPSPRPMFRSKKYWYSFSNETSRSNQSERR